jgi:hypothetical protein
MSENHGNADVLVIGAGLAGVMASRELATAGLSVQTVDKGRSVGGRLATRRIGEGQADHGAQFFTADAPEFRKMVDEWRRTELVREWGTGWTGGSLADAATQAHPRYYAPGGMNGLVKELAGTLGVRTGVRIVAVELVQGRWSARDEDGGRWNARALVLTPPVPQALALLDGGGVEMSHHDRMALRYVRYESCLVGMFLIDSESNVPEPGLVECDGRAAACWIADNRMKGISEQTVLTVQTDGTYSGRRWDDDDREILAELEEAARLHLPARARVVEAQLKRWRYATPLALHDHRCLVPEGLPPLVFAGDGFLDYGVEGAVLSGLAAGRRLSAMLTG